MSIFEPLHHHRETDAADGIALGRPTTVVQFDLSDSNVFPLNYRPEVR